MNHRVSSILLACSVLVACSQAPEPYGALPTPYQVEWQKMETNMFVHFGPNTFTAAEWGDGSESEDVFNPTDLNCRQWTSVAKQAGFKGVIITAKHHDGFCLWPNPVSKHTVAQSCWKDGKGDVLKDLSEACAADGLKFGVYVSPWDRNDPHYGTDEYNNVFVKTLESALGSYGHVFEQWFDGACGEGPNGKRQVYDWPLFNSTVLKMQPHAIIFSNVGPGCRWMGNEAGVNGRTCWSTMNTEGFSPGNSPDLSILNTGTKNGPKWIGSETDVSIRPGWFWKERENDKVKSVNALLKIYYESVGRNSLLLLNVPADTRGHIHEADSARLVEWRAALDSIFSTDLIQGATITATDTRRGSFGTENLTDDDYDSYWAAKDGVTEAIIDVELPETRRFNRISLQEYIPLGQRVESFRIFAQDSEGNLQLVASETTIGYKRIVLLPQLETSKIRVEITAALACPVLSKIALYQDDIYKEDSRKHEYAEGIINKSSETYVLDLGAQKEFSQFNYAPIYRGRGGVVISYTLQISDNGKDWKDLLTEQMFGNIVNNPVLQHIQLPQSVTARYVRMIPVRCSGDSYSVARFDVE